MENVLVGILGDTAWVRVEGRGSFQNSGGLKDFFGRMLERGFRRFAVDLANCELMDSTFMGTLAGLALRLRETGGGLRVLNTSPRNRDLLAGLGLDQLFELSSAPASAPQPVFQRVETTASSDQKAVILEAHEALASADAANAVKFQDVIEFLRKEKGGEASAD